jgi:hypothetical protein
VADYRTILRVNWHRTYEAEAQERDYSTGDETDTYDCQEKYEVIRRSAVNGGRC